MLKSTLYGLSLSELQEAVKAVGLPAFRGVQLANWLYRKNVLEWDEIKNFSVSDREKLAAHYDLKSLDGSEASFSKGLESTKGLFKARDGHFLESVLISQRDRQTVCLSTQMGCKMACSFCASGKAKFLRNLTAGEIVEQVAWIQRKTGSRVTNIVFMGMGEPLDNFEATMKAIEILIAEWGFQLGGRRVTVSTSGITPKIIEFVERVDGRVRLSVSLHSSKPEVRDVLVPINRKYTIDNLVETLTEVHNKLKREITFEYTLIENINDTEEEARGVAKIAVPLNAKVNLIPYNPIREMAAVYKTPSLERIEKFERFLKEKGIHVTLRKTAGREIDAADENEHLNRIVRLEELTALLDGMTNGEFSRKLESVYQQQPQLEALWRFQNNEQSTKNKGEQRGS